MRPFAIILLFASSAGAGIVQDVQMLLSRGDFAAAERAARVYRQAHGDDAEAIRAWSVLARRALDERRYADADRYAAETYERATALLRSRALDADRGLPLALGAAIEVRAQSAAAQGERDQAVTFLRGELAKYRRTSMAARIQKNINMLTLEGKAAPALAGVGALAGRPTLLFFWAHWCGDCKEQAPIIEKLKSETPNLRVIAPTQTYGYAEGGREVPRAEELAYIERVRRQFYLGLNGPVSQENFRRYGASTTPTLVVVDARGIVRLYHPGNLSYEKLRAAVARTLSARPSSRPPRYRTRPASGRQSYSRPAQG